jgi:hypothetical protein
MGGTAWFLGGLVGVVSNVSGFPLAVQSACAAAQIPKTLPKQRFETEFFKKGALGNRHVQLEIFGGWKTTYITYFTYRTYAVWQVQNHLHYLPCLSVASVLQLPPTLF